MTSQTYIAEEGDTVDTVVFEYFGTTSNGIVEQILAANPGLADLGPRLPAGTRIVIPAIDTTAQVQGVRLWY